MHPYDMTVAHLRSDETGRIWYAGTLASLLTGALGLKEGDRAWVAEALCWLVYRTITLLDASTALRWVPEDRRLGGNNLPAGAGFVPCGNVTTEGIWQIAASYDWADADVNQTYEPLAVEVYATAGNVLLGATPLLTVVPAYLRIRCVKFVTTTTAMDGFHCSVFLQSGGYAGGAGGTGVSPLGKIGNGPGGLSGPLYLMGRGGGGGSGGNSLAGAGSAGGDSEHITGALLGGGMSTNAVGAAPSGVNGGVPNPVTAVNFRTWDDVEPGGAIVCGGGGGGGGAGKGNVDGGAGGYGGGILLVEAGYLGAVHGALNFYAFGQQGQAGAAAAGASGNGGGGGGGGGSGGLVRVRYRRSGVVGVGTFVTDAAGGLGGAGGAGDGAGNPGGNGSAGQAGQSLLVAV